METGDTWLFRIITKVTELGLISFKPRENSECWTYGAYELYIGELGILVRFIDHESYATVALYHWGTQVMSGPRVIRHYAKDRDTQEVGREIAWEIQKFSTAA